jgi:methyltransferase (TIGR00027 family)
MAKQTVGRTALGAAVCRLIEQYEPVETRLFNDPVVKGLLGAPVRMMMSLAGLRKFTVQQTDSVGQGIFGAQICRTRYIDEAVQAAISKGIDQLVILGAGLDTRPYRLFGVEHIKVYEVDLPAVQNDKKKKIKAYLGRLPDWVSFIPIDFDQQSIATVFDGSSFDLSKPAVFIWEGVTQYISAEAVSQTLAFVGRSAPGSLIVFTYVLKSVIERRSNIPGAEHMLDVIEQQSPWIFGLEPASIPAFLEPFHLSLITDIGAADYQERYLRPLKRELSVSQVERIAHAAVV